MQESYKNIHLGNMYRLATIWEDKTLRFLQNRIFGAKFEDKSYKYVTIFGSTQCGKTTLILTLIGVKDEHIYELSKILRGSRSFGKSSTATAIIYTKSTDDSFGFAELKSDEQFSEQNEDSHSEYIQCQDVKEFKDRIDEYRRRMSEGRDVPLAVKYFIPSCYFNDTDELNNIVIIDLPGTEASGTESIFARDMANKYRMLSDANIVVVDSREIQKLYDSGNEYRNHINDYGDICYFVSTKALTTYCANDRELAFFDGVFNGDVIKSYYKNVEVDKVRHRSLGDVVNKERIFPVEIGETKENFVLQNPENSEEILTYINNELNTLKSRIVSSNSSSIFKYKNELKIHMNKLLAGISQLDDEINQLESEYKVNHAQLLDISNAVELREKQVLDLNTDLKHFNRAVAQVKRNLNAYKPREKYSDSRNIKEGDYFRDRSRIAVIEENYSNYLKKYESDIRDKINKRILEITKQTSLEITTRQLSFLKGAIDYDRAYINYNECTFKMHFYSKREFSGLMILSELNNRIWEDTGNLLEAMRSFYNSKLDELSKQYANAAKQRLAEIENSKKFDDDLIQSLTNKCREKESILTEYRTNRESIQIKYDEYSHFYENFHSIVKEFYSEEITKINDALNDRSVSADKKFLLLLTANHMEKVFNSKVKE